LDENVVVVVVAVEVDEGVDLMIVYCCCSRFLLLVNTYVGQLDNLKQRQNMCTVKPVYNDHPWDPKFVTVVVVQR